MLKLLSGSAFAYARRISLNKILISALTGNADWWFDLDRQEIQSTPRLNITHKMPDAERCIHVYDPEANEFAKPIPVSPLELPTGLCHSFFCPELNAFIIHRAGGDNQPGNTWAYRYKRLPR